MGLYREKKSPYWWARFQIAGVDIRKSTGEVDRRRAAIVERRMRVEAESKAPRRRGPGDKTLADIGALDINRATDLGPQRRQTILEIWRTIVRTMGDVTANRITSKDIDAYVSKRRSQNVRGQTIRREIQSIKRGFLLAGFPVPSPWPDAKNDKRLRSSPPKQANAGKLHSEDVVWKWIGALPQDAADEALFIWLTGLRLAECKRVLPDWVRGAGENAPVPAYLDLPPEATKTREPRTVGLAPMALEIIQRRMQAPGIPVFSPANHRKAYCSGVRAIGYPVQIIPRDLRHMHLTTGTYLTGDARAAMAAAGHRNLETTNRYLHSTEHRTGAIAAAVAALVGRSRPDDRPKDAICVDKIH